MDVTYLNDLYAKRAALNDEINREEMRVNEGHQKEQAERAYRGVQGTGSNTCQTRIPSLEEQIRGIFTYHPAGPEEQKKYETIRDAACHLALVICRNIPYGSDRQAAIRHLRECVMTANQSIALKGLEYL